SAAGRRLALAVPAAGHSDASPLAREAVHNHRLLASTARPFARVPRQRLRRRGGWEYRITHREPKADPAARGALRSRSPWRFLAKPLRDAVARLAPIRDHWPPAGLYPARPLSYR